jgi:hypothetical protein
MKSVDQLEKLSKTLRLKLDEISALLRRIDAPFVQESVEPSPYGLRLEWKYLDHRDGGLGKYTLAYSRDPDARLGRPLTELPLLTILKIIEGGFLDRLLDQAVNAVALQTTLTRTQDAIDCLDHLIEERFENEEKSE